MKFSELPPYLEHELLYKRFENMRSAISPFVQYVKESNYKDISICLDRLLERITKQDTENIMNETQILSAKIIMVGLNEIEPDFLYKSIEIFTLNSLYPQKYVAIMIENTIIHDVLLKILKMKYQLKKSYFRNYFVKDILDDQYYILTDYSNCLLLLRHEFLPERIIYIDFRKINNNMLKKNLLLPFKISELKDVFL